MGKRSDSKVGRNASTSWHMSVCASCGSTMNARAALRRNSDAMSSFPRPGGNGATTAPSAAAARSIAQPCQPLGN